MLEHRIYVFLTRFAHYVEEIMILKRVDTGPFLG